MKKVFVKKYFWDTIIKLRNNEIWKQSIYSYAYNLDVIFFEFKIRKNAIRFKLIEIFPYCNIIYNLFLINNSYICQSMNKLQE